MATGGAGEDILLGDNGEMNWVLGSDTIAGRPDVFDHLNASTVVMLDADKASLDRITTTDPTLGGPDRIEGNGNTLVDTDMDGDSDVGDLIFGGTDGDVIYGDTPDSDVSDEADGVDGADLVFGDHGKIYPTLPTADAFFVNNNFFSIDILAADAGSGDVVFGDAADDIMIGGQGDDILFGQRMMMTWWVAQRRKR